MMNNPNLLDDPLNSIYKDLSALRYEANQPKQKSVRIKS